MLVLSRKKFERILIGENIAVTIVNIAGNRVGIGIEAPREIRVARGEIISAGSQTDGKPLNK